jgi:hypothetical protein
MVNALPSVFVVVGRGTMRVWLEVRFRISTWVLSWELVWNMRVQCTAHRVLVKSDRGWIDSRWVHRREPINAES